MKIFKRDFLDYAPYKGKESFHLIFFFFWKLKLQYTTTTTTNQSTQLHPAFPLPASLISSLLRSVMLYAAFQVLVTTKLQ